MAERLWDAIHHAAPGAEITRLKETPQAMDFGASLLIILGTATAHAVAGGIATWIARNSGVTLTITTTDGEVVANHVTSKNASEMVAAALSRNPT
jgi:hypothetical protein